MRSNNLETNIRPKSINNFSFSTRGATPGFVHKISNASSQTQNIKIPEDPEIKPSGSVHHL